MGKVRSLYDAIVKTKVEEDKCTNFLLWLLQKSPSIVLKDICRNAGLSIPKTDDTFSFEIQYTLDKSRPDALIQLSEDNYLVLETKRFPDSFDKTQFINHLKSATKEFGENNVWSLFLSGDERVPYELTALKRKYPGRIGFIGWNSVLSILQQASKSPSLKGVRILIEEFIIFARHLRLGRMVSMDRGDIKRFLETYPFVSKFEESVQDTFKKTLEKLKDGCIIECNEVLEESDDRDDANDELPNIYKGFYVENWHIDTGAYLFINIITKTAGIVLTGYQDEKEKKKFLPVWDKYYKQKYKNDKKLSAFTWIEEGEDENAISEGYFKKVEGTSGKQFNPTKISEFEKYFYWGYSYPVDENSIASLIKIIPIDCKKLIEAFPRKRN